MQSLKAALLCALTCCNAVALQQCIACQPLWCAAVMQQLPQQLPWNTTKLMAAVLEQSIKAAFLVSAPAGVHASMLSRHVQDTATV